LQERIDKARAKGKEKPDKTEQIRAALA
jgi:hypothetical protein